MEICHPRRERRSHPAALKLLQSSVTNKNVCFSFPYLSLAWAQFVRMLAGSNFTFWNVAFPYSITYFWTHTHRHAQCWLETPPPHPANEPAHEIMALFVLRKHILQTRMCSHQVGLDVWFWLDPSSTSIIHVSEQRSLERLCGCAVVWAFGIITIISWAGSNVYFRWQIWILHTSEHDHDFTSVEMRYALWNESRLFDRDLVIYKL